MTMAQKKILLTPSALLDELAAHQGRMADVARKYGVSRERIRQLRNEADSTGVWRAEIARRRAIARAEAQRAALYEEFARRAESAEPCRICGSWVLRIAQGRNGTQAVTCSPECSVQYARARLYLNPDQYEKHRYAVARWRVASGRGTSHDFRVLSGKHEGKRRWHLDSESSRAVPDHVELPPLAKRRQQT